MVRRPNASGFRLIQANSIGENSQDRDHAGNGQSGGGKACTLQRNPSQVEEREGADKAYQYDTSKVLS
jgi:hypothetical protein